MEGKKWSRWIKKNIQTVLTVQCHDRKPGRQIHRISLKLKVNIPPSVSVGMHFLTSIWNWTRILYPPLLPPRVPAVFWGPPVPHLGDRSPPSVMTSGYADLSVHVTGTWAADRMDKYTLPLVNSTQLNPAESWLREWALTSVLPG